ncbi:MAG TPA: thiamine diphosphokinase [Clostridia bacterium]|nr:thiamine diphosphokinase [Clostridia bacterium]
METGSGTAIILADGDAPTAAQLDLAWPNWADDVTLVIAADGGARHAPGLGLRIDCWVGDGDSIGDDALADLAASGVEIRRVAEAKDESDTELALALAIERGAGQVVVLGAFGGVRLDHALANVGLLAMPALAGRPAALLDERSRVRLVQAPGPDGGPVRLGLPGRTGDLVSLLPYGHGVEGVTTEGLAYPLRDEPLPAGPARGLSNVRTGNAAAVTVRSGLLLVVETPATLVG